MPTIADFTRRNERTQQRWAPVCRFDHAATRTPGPRIVTPARQAAI